MYSLRRETKLALVAVTVLFAIYFPIARWLKYSEPDLAGISGTKLHLKGHFVRRGFSRFAYVARVQQLNQPEDNNVSPERSRIMLYENGRALGPAHSLHADIEDIGRGRFSHWNDIGVIFSTSDNSDPNSNGRTYWAVAPPSP
jgi:hypothetical protein